jgi:16S rRNA (cytosine967-C5)-methyltransferase
MAVASAVAPAPGWRVLDLCAAPGGKATQQAELIADRGEVVACDIDETRLQIVGGLARRLGLSAVRCSRLQAQDSGELPPGPFDAALVDVPCSNTGVLGRRPEVRWRLQPNDLLELPALQARLLRQAAQRVPAGGVVVYSTCSIEPEENRQVVQAFVKEQPGWRLETESEAIPGRPADGGYWARLCKV